MLITCERCGRRYRIAPERLVTGRALRVRCRHCDGQIEVRPQLHEATEPHRAVVPDEEPTSIDRAPVERLTAERNEASLLFSLDQLQAMAAAGPVERRAVPAPSRRDEGSGLIDVRALAARTLAAAPVEPMLETLPSFSVGEIGGAGPSLAPPPALMGVVALPAPTTTRRSWMWGLVAGLTALACSATGAALALWAHRSAPVMAPSATTTTNTAPIVISAAHPPAPACAAAVAPTDPPSTAARTATTAPSTPARALRARRSPPTTSTAVKGTAPDVGEVPTDVNERTTERTAERATGRATERVPGRAAGPINDDGELAALINRASTTGHPSPSRAAATGAISDGGPVSLPARLDNADIVAAMRNIRPRVDACFAQYHAPGTATVRARIVGEGRLESVTLGGELAGTPSGECVARAVRNASFKRFSGPPMSIEYPFLLR